MTSSGWAVLVAVAYLVGPALAAQRLSAVVLAGPPASVRACGSVTALAWLLVVGCFGLALFGAFAPGPALGLSLVLGVAAVAPGREALAAGVRADGRAVRAAVADIGWIVGALGGVVVTGIGGLVLVRGIVTPPLGWDDLTYRLFKAGTWVQAGRFTTEPAPDAWQYYDYFPGNGEVLWSWLLLAERSGALLAVGSVTTWLACLLGTYAAARALGIERRGSTVAALALGTVPAVAVFSDTSYVDNLVLASTVCGLALLLDARRRPSWCGLGLGLAALAVGAGTKSTGLTVLALGALYAVAFAPWPGRLRSGLARLAVAATAVTAVVAPWYLRAWIDRGSPLYPYPSPVPGLDWPRNEQLARLVGAPADSASFADELGWSWHLLATRDLNWPPAPWFYLLLAFVGVVLALLWPRRRAEVGLLVAIAATGLTVLAASDAHGLRHIWGDVLGRLVTPSLAALVLLAATVAMRWLWPAWLALVAAQGWRSVSVLIDSSGAADRAAVTDLATRSAGPLAVAAVVVALAVLARHRRPSRDRRAAAGGAVAVALVVASVLVAASAAVGVRDDHRYDLYRASLEEDLYRAHGLGPGRCLHPLWEHVDVEGPTTIAVVAGFQIFGHTSFRFPFLGSDLQNRVVYVPVTTDGSLVDYEDLEAVRAAFDADAWLARLDALDVDHIALLHGDLPEAEVIGQHPERFTLAQHGACNDAVLHRFVG
jgi:hypothetical protein